MKTTLKAFYQSLDPKSKARYAKAAGTTTGYIECHLLYARKVPRPVLLRKLALASNGALKFEDLLEFFYQQ